MTYQKVRLDTYLKEFYSHIYSYIINLYLIVWFFDKASYIILRLATILIILSLRQVGHLEQY